MKKVIIITTGDPLAGIACRRIFDESRSGEFIISAVVNSSMSFKKSWRIASKGIEKGSLFYVVYMFAEIYFLKVASFLISFCVFLSRKKSGFFDIFSYCRKNNIPVISAPDINSKDCMGKIHMVGADIYFSIRPSQIFGKGFIGSFPRILNLHCTALPRYRGIGGIFQAMLHEDTELGYTLHTIEAGVIDGGLIVAQSQLPVNRSWSLLRCTVELYAASQNLLISALHTKTNYDQTPSGPGSYFSWPSKEDLKVFLSKGKKFISLSDVSYLSTF